MIGYHEERFEYLGLDRSIGWCEVTVYWDLRGIYLVLIRDFDDHHSTSVTNAIETVCGLIQTRVLDPLGVPLKSTLPANKGNTLWVAWSVVDGMYSKVVFADPLSIRKPQFSFIAQDWLSNLCQQFGIEPLTQAKL